MKHILTICLLMLLGACAQNKAGFSVWDLKACESKAGTPYVCRVHVTHGKDSQNISFKAKTPSGLEVELTADSSIGSTGQAIRGEVDQALIEAGSEVLPGLVEAVTEAVGP